MELFLIALGGLALFLIARSGSSDTASPANSDSSISTRPPTRTDSSTDAPTDSSSTEPTAPSEDDALSPAFTFESGFTAASTLKKSITDGGKTSAPPPPPVTTPPGAPTGVMEALIQYNVDGINSYRSKKGVPAVVEDKKLDEYALAGSQQLLKDHIPHAHIEADVKAGTIASFGFSGGGAENQGDPHGIFSFSSDMLSNGKQQIDWALAKMYDEGPGGGHYDNMMNGAMRRVGIGIVFDGARMYMTNDFSG